MQPRPAARSRARHVSVPCKMLPTITNPSRRPLGRNAIHSAALWSEAALQTSVMAVVVMEPFLSAAHYDLIASRQRADYGYVIGLSGPTGG
ncbi:Hypothetical protein NTJ_13608 [Nesidiocoris tenuis]|uniref:Uncharacterized protein n=1 Tax=Nesidiocoris tenuis TaxID=355587 RepID=A0ABN7B8T0_9HEMI|nr:Hypothetical protein NTJ_13608 [Nesidiocoris tenuis]